MAFSKLLLAAILPAFVAAQNLPIPVRHLRSTSRKLALFRMEQCSDMINHFTDLSSSCLPICLATGDCGCQSVRLPRHLCLPTPHFGNYHGHRTMREVSNFESSTEGSSCGSCHPKVHTETCHLAPTETHKSSHLLLTDSVVMSVPPVPLIIR